MLPAADGRNLRASRGIPLTDGYWAELCASCAAPGTNAGVSEAPLKYARVLNRFVREVDAQAALAKVSASHTSVKQAQELIRRSILMKIKGGPAELRRAFQQRNRACAHTHKTHTTKTAPHAQQQSSQN